jgi:hypothetical protein
LRATCPALPMPVVSTLPDDHEAGPPPARNPPLRALLKSPRPRPPGLPRCGSECPSLLLSVLPSNVAAHPRAASSPTPLVGCSGLLDGACGCTLRA